MMNNLIQDLRCSLRTLSKNPGFAVVTVLILAVAIGANTTLFSALHGLLSRSLPFERPDRLMSVWSISSNPQLKHFPFINTSIPDYYDWVKQSRSFRDLSAINHKWCSLTGTPEPLAVTGWAVTADFFKVFEKPPMLGRGFLAEEIGPRKAKVVILSHALWRRTFGGRPDILGQKVTLENEPYTVVGVAHPDMAFRQDFVVDFYIPMDLAPDSARYLRRLWVIGRLKPGVTQAQAATEMQTIMARLAKQYPDTNAEWSAKLIPLQELLFGDIRWAMAMLYAAAALLALIACANIANLLIARGGARSAEMAVRSALGASRFRLGRQMLTESLVLSLAGGALGFAGSWWGVDLMRWMVSDLQKSSGVSGSARIDLDVSVLAFTVASCLAATMLFGLFPSWHASRTRPADALREGSRGASEGRERRRASAVLVVAEVSLAFVLLAGFGLVYRSLDRLMQVPLGYSPSGLTALELTVPTNSDYDRGESQKRAEFVRATLDRVRAIPGVLSAASVNIHPLSQNNVSNAFNIERRAPSRLGEEMTAEHRTVSADYFSTMGIPLSRGRVFTRADNGARNVVIVDEELVRRYFPNEDPIGQKLSFWGRTVEIVGVVGSIQPPRAADKAIRAHMYEPIDQWCHTAVTFVVRSDLDPAALSTSLRRAVWSVNPAQPVLHVRPMRSLVRDRMSLPRLITTISASFAISALALALLGIYGVMAYRVRRQTRDIGIRMAFGAQRREILGSVVGKGMVTISAGLLVGLVAALASSRAVSSLLYEPDGVDPLVYCGVIVLMALTGGVACYIPARRAAKIDPAEALRCE
jgi:predicted permease